MPQRTAGVHLCFLCIQRNRRDRHRLHRHLHRRAYTRAIQYLRRNIGRAHTNGAHNALAGHLRDLRMIRKPAYPLIRRGFRLNRCRQHKLLALINRLAGRLQRQRFRTLLNHNMRRYGNIAVILRYRLNVRFAGCNRRHNAILIYNSHRRIAAAPYNVGVAGIGRLHRRHQLKGGIPLRAQSRSSNVQNDTGNRHRRVRLHRNRRTRNIHLTLRRAGRPLGRLYADNRRTAAYGCHQALLRHRCHVRIAARPAQMLLRSILRLRADRKMGRIAGIKLQAFLIQLQEIRALLDNNFIFCRNFRGRLCRSANRRRTGSYARHNAVLVYIRDRHIVAAPQKRKIIGILRQHSRLQLHGSIRAGRPNRYLRAFRLNRGCRQRQHSHLSRALYARAILRRRIDFRRARSNARDNALAVHGGDLLIIGGPCILLIRCVLRRNNRLDRGRGRLNDLLVRDAYGQPRHILFYRHGAFADQLFIRVACCGNGRRTGRNRCHKPLRYRRHLRIAAGIRYRFVRRIRRQNRAAQLNRAITAGGIKFCCCLV